MNGYRCFSLALAALLLVSAGCRKKNSPTAENTLPSGEDTRSGELPPNATVPMPTPLGARPPTAEGELTAPPVAAVTEEGVSPDVAAADAAYEAWFKKYDLDLTNPVMLEEDSDGDGFNNREEFLAETNPRDPNSIPGVHPTLRLKSYTRKDLPYRLRGVEGATAQIEISGDKMETLRAGQSIPGTNYKVSRVRSGQARDKDGRPFDASRVTLEDTRSRQRLELVKDMPARSGDSFAVLAAPGGSGEITVHEGETFALPNDPNTTFRVRELRAEQVILEELSSGKVWTVPKS